MPEISEHLRGPWLAILAEENRRTYTDLADVPDDREVAVMVVRGTAGPVDGVVPEEADDLDVLLLATPDDFSDWVTELQARWEQAQGVAEALNGRTELEQLRAAVRRVVSLTQDTDGDALDIDETVPVGEVLRVLYEFHEDVVERACLSRSANEPGA